MNFLNEFKDYLLENEKSKKTIESYVLDIKNFFGFYKKDISEITKNDIQDYKTYLRTCTNKNGDPLSVRTLNRKLVGLHQYIEFMNEIHGAGITVKVKQEKVQTQDIQDDILDNNDVIRIIRAAEKEDDVRAKAIFYTLFYTGTRVSEMLQFRKHDIKKDTIEVLGKGDKTRKVFIPKKLTDVWKQYEKVRIDKTDYLFTGERGRLSRQTVHNIIKKYTGKARGIDKDIAHAHAFRHLYARNLASLGINPVLIAQLLGHRLNVTGIYMAESKKELLKAINQLSLEDPKRK